VVSWIIIVVDAYLTVVPVEILPDEMHAINVAMMEIESRFQGREVKVGTWVTRDGEMPSSVHTDAYVHCFWYATITLDDGLEDFNVCTAEDRIRRVTKGCPLDADIGIEISLDTARVVLQRVGRPDWAEIDREVCEWCSLLQTASARAGLCTTDGSTMAGDVFTVTTERCLTSIEHWGFVDISAIQSPFPVREVSWKIKLDICSDIGEPIGNHSPL
jgi:hypothetical protein